MIGTHRHQLLLDCRGRAGADVCDGDQHGECHDDAGGGEDGASLTPDASRPQTCGKVSASSKHKDGQVK